MMETYRDVRSQYAGGRVGLHPANASAGNKRALLAPVSLDIQSKTSTTNNEDATVTTINL
jgi:hypothetical protein